MQIYTLVDPRAPEHIRYVGKTIRLLSTRLVVHISRAKRGSASHHNARWLRKLATDGVRPIIQLLEECAAEVVDERERYWIVRLRSEGHDLTNTTPGGEGGATNTGRKFTVEHKAKIGAANAVVLRGQVMSAEWRAKQSAVKKGKPWSAARRAAHEETLLAAQ